MRANVYSDGHNWNSAIERTIQQAAVTGAQNTK
jgi:hypothetical protein